jgi:hypothetical protein
MGILEGLYRKFCDFFMEMGKMDDFAYMRVKKLAKMGIFNHEVKNSQNQKIKKKKKKTYFE